MSSAFLYLAIIAIWVGVLIPRWLKRDSSRAKAAKASQPPLPEARQSESPEATQSPDELTDNEPVEVNAGADAGGAGVHMADGNIHAEVGPSRADGAGRAAGRGRVAGANRVASASGPRAADGAQATVTDQAEPSGYEPGEAAGLRPADPQARRRVLSARRRMLMMLIVLAAAAVGIALIGMAAWWVAIPPIALLGGYLVLLREVRQADTERALIRADAEQRAEEQRAEEQRLREAREAAAVKQREEAQTARIIDISGRMRDELYDQYAEGQRRAVGD
jgi:hypothetical protein